MNYPLQKLLDIYSEPNNDGTFARGYGVETLIAFYRLLEIPEPLTCDLSENLIRSVTKHIRSELQPQVSEPMIADIQDFMRFIYPDWCQQNYSEAAVPKTEYAHLLHLSQYSSRIKKR